MSFDHLANRAFRINTASMTYSILVRDRETGALGAAVASKFFAVGAMCIHVEGRVGALATQALVNPMYAVRAMPRLRAGEAPDTIMADLVLPDPGRLQRQFHIIDAQGRIAQHTGPDCVTWAGHVNGQDVSVAGNMLVGPDVVARTRDAFLASSGDLALRLITAMEAGEAAGGDKRGRQSAGIKICTDDPYPDLDIRADDHADPLAELRRLHRVSLERFAVFRRHLAGARMPYGELDRTVIDADIALNGRPL